MKVALTGATGFIGSRRAAQATADMVIRAARSAPGSRLGATVVPYMPLAAAASGYCQI